MTQRPPLLGRRSTSNSAAKLARTDPPARSNSPARDEVADRLRTRPTEEGLLAARARPEDRVATRSTAPPPGAVLPADPIAVRPAAAETIGDIGPLPPLQLSQDTPATAPRATPTTNDLARIRTLVNESKAQLAPIQTYSVRMTRQERVGDTLQPEEEVILNLRREPRAVRLEWPDGPNAGREVLYVSAPNGGTMHIKMANPLVPRMSLPPDSPLALRQSRHPITEAGVDAMIARLEETVAMHESGRAAGEKLTYEGCKAPIPGAPACHMIQRVTATGETWLVGIDAQTHWPYLVQETAADGSLLERYIFRDQRTDLPELAAANAFDPEVRWGPAMGLLGRLARTSGDDSPADASASR